MQLQVYKTDCNVTPKFISFLVRIIKNHIMKDLGNKKLSYLNSCIKEDVELQKSLGLNRPIDIRGVIRQSIRRLKYREIKDCYIIYLDMNARIPGQQATYYDICNFLDYGNLEYTGFPIYSRAFDHVSANMDFYFQLYKKLYLIGER